MRSSPHANSMALSYPDSGSPENLTESQRDTIAAVLKGYGGHTGRWLSALTHQEDPWKDARKGLASRERGHKEITLGALNDYYGSL